MSMTLFDVMIVVLQIVNAVVPVIIGLAVLYFFWGLAMYIMKADNREARGAAGRKMFIGVVTIFVMVSVYGIVALLESTLDLNNATPMFPFL